MIPILFEKDARAFKTLGLGFLPSWIKDTIEVLEEENGKYCLTGELPVDGLNVDQLAIDRIICAAPAPGKKPQPFRIHQIEKPADSDTVKVYAPHISYQLSQSAIPSVNASYTGAQAMSWLFSNCVPSESGIFTPYSDITASKTIQFTEPLTVRAALSGSDNSLVNVFGGELEYDEWTVKLLASRGRSTGKYVRYGENLETLSYDTDASTMVTAYLGYAKYHDSVILGNIVPLRGADAFQYPRIYLLDLTSTFDDFETTPTAGQIESATILAAIDFKFPHFGIRSADLKTYINITAVPDSLRDVYLCDTITVVHPGYNYQQTAKIVRTVFDPITEKYKEITIGEMKKTITDTIAGLLRGGNK